MIKAGIAQDKAEKLLLKYGAKALDDALLVMHERRGRLNMEPVRSPEKYLVTILQSGQFGMPKLVDPPAEKIYDTKAERMKLIERYMAQKRTELNDMFNEMPLEDQQQWIVKFEEEALPASGAMRKTYDSKGIASQIVRPAFLKFLGNTIWEDGWEKPSDSDLVDLAIRSKHDQTMAHELRQGSKVRIELGMKKS